MHLVQISEEWLHIKAFIFERLSEFIQIHAYENPVLLTSNPLFVVYHKHLFCLTQI